METLIFQLHGSMSSWGETAMGEYRPSADYPSQSAIHGLLGAALGIERADDAAHAALRDSCRIAIGVLATGRLLRDFHTAQVPSRADLKKRPHATRRDELSVPKPDLNTILSTRDYRQDAASLVALQAREGGAYSLALIEQALLRPKFLLYLGRKSCPLAAPLHPRFSAEPTISAALAAYVDDCSAHWPQQGRGKSRERMRVRRIAWGDDFGSDDAVTIGEPRYLSVTRKDLVLARTGWQFGDRQEHIAILEEE